MRKIATVEMSRGPTVNNSTNNNRGSRMPAAVARVIIGCAIRNGSQIETRSWIAAGFEEELYQDG